jgi:hypothetical protein
MDGHGSSYHVASLGVAVPEQGEGVRCGDSLWFWTMEIVMNWSHSSRIH